MTHLQGSPCFPRIIEHGSNPDYRWLVIEILGPCLAHLRCEMLFSHFSKFTSLLLARDMLKCIEEVHRRGIIHRDIKPSNFLLKPKSDHLVCLIDFGLSRYYIELGTGDVQPPLDPPRLCGTAKFWGMKLHLRQDQGRGGDLISWFYSVIEMTSGQLPWPTTRDEKKVMAAKRKVTPELLCKKYPPEVAEIYRYVDGLRYYDDPDYERIYGLLEVARTKVKQRPALDWEKMGRRALKRISALDIQNADGEHVRVFNRAGDIEAPSYPVCNVM
jgi:serine/threonine protein kinase